MLTDELRFCADHIEQLRRVTLSIDSAAVRRVERKRAEAAALQAEAEELADKIAARLEAAGGVVKGLAGEFGTTPASQLYKAAVDMAIDDGRVVRRSAGLLAADRRACP